MTARGAFRCSSSPRLSRAIARGRRYVSVLPLLDRTSTNVRAECCEFSITESRIRVAWMPSDFPPNQRCFGKNFGKSTVSSRRRPPLPRIPSQPSAILKGALSRISMKSPACQPPWRCGDWKTTSPKGGSVMFNEKGFPCIGRGAAVKPPKLPWSLPPYMAASLFKTSFQRPAKGTATR